MNADIKTKDRKKKRIVGNPLKLLGQRGKFITEKEDKDG